MNTSEKVLQFRKEIENMDTLLMNTKTINLDELRSACKIDDNEEAINLGTGL